MASIGRAPSNQNFTMTNGTTDFEAYKQNVQNLFEQIPCDNNVRDQLLFYNGSFIVLVIFKQHYLFS